MISKIYGYQFNINTKNFNTENKFKNQITLNKNLIFDRSVITVSRTIPKSGFNQICKNIDITKNLFVKFEGEKGIDATGLAREFISIIGDYIKDNYMKAIEIDYVIKTECINNATNNTTNHTTNQLSVNTETQTIKNKQNNLSNLKPKVTKSDVLIFDVKKLKKDEDDNDDKEDKDDNNIDCICKIIFYIAFNNSQNTSLNISYSNFTLMIIFNFFKLHFNEKLSVTLDKINHHIIDITKNK